MNDEQRLLADLRAALTAPGHRLDPAMVDLEAVHRRAGQRRRRTGIAATALVLAATLIVALASFPGIVSSDPLPPAITPSPAAVPECEPGQLQQDFSVQGRDQSRDWLVSYFTLLPDGYGELQPCSLADPGVLKVARGLALDARPGTAAARPNRAMTRANVVTPGQQVAFVTEVSSSSCDASGAQLRTYGPEDLAIVVSGRPVPLGGELSTCGTSAVLGPWHVGTPVDVLADALPVDLPTCTLDMLYPDFPAKSGDHTLYFQLRVAATLPHVGCVLRHQPGVVYDGTGRAPSIGPDHSRWWGWPRKAIPTAVGREGTLHVAISGTACTSGTPTRPRSYHADEFSLSVEGETYGLYGPSITSCGPLTYSPWLGR